MLPWMKILRFAYFRVIKNATVFFCTKYTEQNPSWDTNCFLASQGFHDILWNLTVHYNAYRILWFFPILSHMNPVHALISSSLSVCFSFGHFNEQMHTTKMWESILVLAGTSRSSKWFSSFRFPHQSPLNEAKIKYSGVHSLILWCE